MFRKLITRTAIVAALGIAALGATATGASAGNLDSGAAKFGGGIFTQPGSVTVSPATCNLATHRASFGVSVVQPGQYLNGINFSVIVYMRDVSANGAWQSTGQVTSFINSQRMTPYGGSVTQPVAFSNTNVAGIAGHYYEFRVYFNWAPPGGYWQGWQYFGVAPFSWLFQNGSSISGYAYCHL